MGIISSDHDIEMIFVDSVTKHADISLENLAAFIEKLDKISKDFEIEFIVSISADKEELGSIVDTHEILND